MVRVPGEIGPLRAESHVECRTCVEVPKKEESEFKNGMSLRADDEQERGSGERRATISSSPTDERGHSSPATSSSSIHPIDSESRLQSPGSSAYSLQEAYDRQQDEIEFLRFKVIFQYLSVSSQNLLEIVSWPFQRFSIIFAGENLDR